MDFIHKLPGWFRWILVPISVVITFIVVSLLTGLFFWFQSKMLGLGDDAWIDLLWRNAFAPALTGFAAVYSGVYCAPNFKKVVSLVVGALLVLMAGISLLGLLSRGDWWGVINVLFTVGGVGGAIYSTFDEESKL